VELKVEDMVWFWGKIGVEGHWGGAPELIDGCGMCPEGLKFKLEIKSEFLWKMKSREIWILEFFWIKLRVGIARERSCASVLVIPQRKLSLVEDFHGGRLLRDLSALLPAIGSSPEREWRGRRSREGEGRLLTDLEQLGVHGGAAPGGLGPDPAVSELLCAFSVPFYEVEEKEKREKRKKKMEKEKKEKIWENFWNLKIFPEKNKS
jgi:hypothetical protein